MLISKKRAQTISTQLSEYNHTYLKAKVKNLEGNTLKKIRTRIFKAKSAFQKRSDSKISLTFFVLIVLPNDS